MKNLEKQIIKKPFSYNVDQTACRLKSAKGKKFLAVFDGLRFSSNTLEYALQLTKDAEAFLEGVFLDEFIHFYGVSTILGSYEDAEKLLDQQAKKDNEKRDESVKEFERACSKAGVHYSFHRNTGIAIHELKQESIFADLVIINSKETFSLFPENSPAHFIKELLPDVQCPVLITPGKFRPIDKITLLYDGRPSSVFAIKMFGYLFGDLRGTPVEVFTVKDSMEGSHLPNNKLMREFIKRHFPKAKYIVEKGKAEEQVLGHLRYHKSNELVVLGAYRRREMSRWFKTSMADILMKELDIPLFITHNK